MGYHPAWNDLNRLLVMLTLLITLRLSVHLFLYYRRITNNWALATDSRRYLQRHRPALFSFLGLDRTERGEARLRNLSRISLVIFSSLYSLWIWALLVVLGIGKEIEHLVITCVVVFTITFGAQEYRHYRDSLYEQT